MTLDDRPDETRPPAVAIVPSHDEGLVRAVVDGGGKVVAPSDADAIVWTHPLDAEGLRATLSASSATWVQLPFAGVEAFVEAGVIDHDHLWTCTKGAYGHATAEHALALMLAASRRIHEHVRSRTWRPAGLGSPERRLKGCTVLVVGTGGIGRALVGMLPPLGPRIVAVNRSGTQLEGAERTARVSELGELVGDADFVVLAAALTSETRGLFDASLLGRMRSDAWLVNVARGGLVDTGALVDALESNSLGGAALDVTDPEPLPDGHPLWDMDDVIITPHVANTWDMALPELRDVVRRNVARFAEGRRLEGVVDPSLGY